MQQELAVAVRSAGWRGLARAGKRRAVRLLAARRAAVRPVRRFRPVADAVGQCGRRGRLDRHSLRGLDRPLRHGGRRDAARPGGAGGGDPGAQPLISIIFPVYNSPEEFLRQAIDSVRAQLYTKWELCIADDCSTLPHVAKVLDEYAALDERILVHRRQTNGHISACSNSAVALASGSWLCLMDHDDVLAEHALAVCALALQRHPEAAIVYSDEDHIEADGSRSQPYFKPDFDPLLILGQNYFSHLSLVRADLVELVGGFREGYEGSQDWDLLLRVLEQVRPDQVVHVPHVLYHWRVHSESTASSVSAKPYVVDASRRVVEEHLKRIGVEATVTTVWDTSYNRIEWELPPSPPKVSIIILPRSGPYPGPLYRQCPHAHALPGARDPAGRRRGVPSPHAAHGERARRMVDPPREHAGHQRLGAEELCGPARRAAMCCASCPTTSRCSAPPGCTNWSARSPIPASAASAPSFSIPISGFRAPGRCWGSGGPWAVPTACSSSGSPTAMPAISGWPGAPPRSAGPPWRSVGICSTRWGVLRGALHRRVR